MTLAAAVLAFATTAAAGVRVETVEQDIKTKAAEGAPQVVLVQDGKVRASGHDGGAVIIKGGRFYFVDDKRKTYQEMDKAQMQQAAQQANAMMSQMQEKLKNMPPEQRAMMEKMMGGGMPGAAPGKAASYDAVDTGKSATVEGRKCRVWQILRNKKPIEELCVAPFSSLPGKENFQQTFEELAKAFEGFSSMAGPDVAAENKARMSVKGYPVRIRTYDDQGKLHRSEVVLKRWVEEAVPAAKFEIPKNYKKRDMPQLGGPPPR
jgi:hypothetical protein